MINSGDRESGWRARASDCVFSRIVQIWDYAAGWLVGSNADFENSWVVGLEDSILGAGK